MRERKIGRTEQGSRQASATANPRRGSAGVDEPRLLAELSPAAVVLWPIVAKQLRDAGVLGAVDTFALASYCEVFARWCSAGEHVARALIELGVISGQQLQKQNAAPETAPRSATPEAEGSGRGRLPPNAIMRRIEVERETGLSRSTIYSRVKAGTFPAPVKLGARSVGWRVADIEAFLLAPATYRIAPTVP